MTFFFFIALYLGGAMFVSPGNTTLAECKAARAVGVWGRVLRAPGHLGVLREVKIKWLAQSPASSGYVLIDFRIHRSGWFYFQINRLVIRAY